MNERISSIKKFFIENGEQKNYRRELDWSTIIDRAAFNSLSDAEKVTLVFEKMLENEEPIVFAFDNIPLVRTVANYPYELFGGENDSFEQKLSLFPSDISPDIGKLLDCGFEDKISEISQFMSVCTDPEKKNYLNCMKRSLEAVLKLVGRYRLQAEKTGNHFVAELLSNIPAHRPASFIGAVAMVRIINFAMWCTGCRGNYLGRPDVYLYEYYQNDVKSGRISSAEALSIIEEFFVSFCKDSDLYVSGSGVYGSRSLVLGGYDEFGRSVYSSLSELFMKAAAELMLPDPQIFLRVDKTTPPQIYMIDPETAAGGFGYPRYINDDAVVNALVGWGYDRKDACTYAVSSRGEPVIPGLGMDIRETGRVNFVESVFRSLCISLGFADDMDTVMDIVRADIRNETKKACENSVNVCMLPAPFHSVMFEGSVENAKDVTLGCKYNNYGINAVGIAVAADILAAVKKYVFEENTVSSLELRDALNRNFEGHRPLLDIFANYGSKNGRDVLSNNIACDFLKLFLEELSGKVNERGGVFKSGIVSGEFGIGVDQNFRFGKSGCGKDGSFDSCIMSPVFSYNGSSPFMNSQMSPCVLRASNGGVVLAVFDKSVLTGIDPVQKIAYTVMDVIVHGGQAVQIEIVDKDLLRDAVVNPQAHNDLVVRLWSSGVPFTRLDRKLQEYIISKAELTI